MEGEGSVMWVTNLLPQLLHLVHHLSGHTFLQHVCTVRAVQEDQDLRAGQGVGQEVGQEVEQVGQEVGQEVDVKAYTIHRLACCRLPHGLSGPHSYQWTLPALNRRAGEGWEA